MIAATLVIIWFLGLILALAFPVFMDGVHNGEWNISYKDRELFHEIAVMWPLWLAVTIIAIPIIGFIWLAKKALFRLGRLVASFRS